MEVEGARAGKGLGDDCALKTGIAGRLKIGFWSVNDTGEHGSSGERHAGATWQSEKGELGSRCPHNHRGESNGRAAQKKLQFGAGREDNFAQIYVAGDVENGIGLNHHGGAGTGGVEV